MADRIEAVIFDYSTVLVNSEPVLSEVRDLMNWVKKRGLKIVLFSTHQRNFERELQVRNLPAADLTATRTDIGISKGSPAWINHVASAFGIQPHQMLYVGDDHQDFTNAINAATFYVEAGWVSKKKTRNYNYFPVQTPQDCRSFIAHYLLLAPRWQFTLDLPEHNCFVRALLYARQKMPSTKPPSFEPFHVLHEHRVVSIGNRPAQTVLMLHAVTSLYLEGLIEPNSFTCLYPKSTPGRTDELLVPFVEPISSSFHAYYKPDLLVRPIQAKNTSLARARGEKVYITDQSNTVHLGPHYQRRKKTLGGKTVIVFDDFTTSGTSLDWARNLLTAAGFGRIVLVSVGKYAKIPPIAHTVYQPLSPIEPFALGSYELADFSSQAMTMKVHEEGLERLRASLEELKKH